MSKGTTTKGTEMKAKMESRPVKARNKKEQAILDQVHIEYMRYNNCYYVDHSNSKWTSYRDEAFALAEEIIKAR